LILPAPMIGIRAQCPSPGTATRFRPGRGRPAMARLVEGLCRHGQQLLVPFAGLAVAAIARISFS